MSDIKDVIIPTDFKNLFLVRGSINLANEIEITDSKDREPFKEAAGKGQGRLRLYLYRLPSFMGLLSLNALAVCRFSQ